MISDTTTWDPDFFQRTVLSLTPASLSSSLPGCSRSKSCAGAQGAPIRRLRRCCRAAFHSGCPGSGAGGEQVSRSRGHIRRVSVSLTERWRTSAWEVGQRHRPGRRRRGNANPRGAAPRTPQNDRGEKPRSHQTPRSTIARVHCGNRHTLLQPPRDLARQFLLKLKTDSPCNPAVAPLGIRSREMESYFHKETGPQVFTAALFVRAPS